MNLGNNSNKTKQVLNLKKLRFNCSWLLVGLVYLLAFYGFCTCHLN